MVADGGAPDISFIVPVRDSATHLRRCLASIRGAVDGFAAEIIVVDNGSTDTSADVARAAGVRLLHQPDNNVSAARNAAAQVAGGALLAFVDADQELARGWAAAAVGLMQGAGAAAVGSPYRSPPGGTWVQQMYDRLRRHQHGTREVEWLPSGNLVVSRAAFGRAGGFDPSLETCEDVDLCQRLRRHGGRILASDELESVHHGDPRTLGALFRGELWRGRDNLRVSLRGPFTWRSIPGVLFPILTLVGMASVAGGLILWPVVTWRLAALGVLVLGLPVCVRAAVLLSADGRRTPPAIMQALLFAAVYEAARALALVARAGHGLRRAD